jgi:hypothetical protein
MIHDVGQCMGVPTAGKENPPLTAVNAQHGGGRWYSSRTVFQLGGGADKLPAGPGRGVDVGIVNIRNGNDSEAAVSDQLCAVTTGVRAEAALPPPSAVAAAEPPGEPAW